MSKSEVLAANLASLLAKHGVPVGEIVQSDDISTIAVGCIWCKYSMAFDVTIPVAFSAILGKIRDTFSGYSIDVGDWSHLGDHGKQFVHLTAWIH